MLISGGYPESPSGRKVELHNLLNNTKCYIEDLPLWRCAHTSVGGIICGGGRAPERSGGSWSNTTKFQSIRDREFFVTWNLNPGKSFMILGGTDSGSIRTTDIVHTN